MKRERYSYSEILDDVTRYFTKIQTNEYLETGLFPIIDQGKEFITGYTNSSIGIYNDYPIIIFGDHTRIFKYIDFPCYLGADGVKALKNIKPDKINSKYLYYYLKNSYIPDTGYNRHFKWVKELFFNIHDIQTQKEIVSILDKVTSLISMRKEQLEKLDILVKSKFIEMFGDPVLNPKGWEKKKLGEVYTIISGTTPDTNEQKYWNGTNLWVTPAELNNEIYINTTARKITDEAIKAKSLKVIPKFSVLLSSRAPIGKLAINTADMYCNQGFKCFINSKVLHSIYTYFYLLHRVEYIQSLGRGATFKEVSKEIVANIEIQVPPLDLQNQFAEFVEQVEKNKENIKSSLNQLETLYNALMQEYFG